jgi:cytochrome o ubiquinol oxidase operon protein cyoD
MKHSSPISHQPTGRKAMSSYIIGFVASLILTIAAYLLVTQQFLQNGALVFILLVFAFVQLIVQLLFFLHLGRESKPRWQLYFLISTVGVIVLVVAGSIWIMHHLNYMTPMQMDKAIIKDEGIHK